MPRELPFVQFSNVSYSAGTLQSLFPTSLLISFL